MDQCAALPRTLMSPAPAATEGTQDEGSNTPVRRRHPPQHRRPQTHRLRIQPRRSRRPWLHRSGCREEIVAAAQIYPLHGTSRNVDDVCCTSKVQFFLQGCIAAHLCARPPLLSACSACGCDLSRYIEECGTGSICSIFILPPKLKRTVNDTHPFADCNELTADAFCAQHCI